VHNRTVHSIILGLLLTLSAPPLSSEAQALIEKSPVVCSPLEGFLTLGEFFFRSHQYERAKQVFLYALLYSPKDGRFLAWLARTELAVGHEDTARRYANSALAAGGSGSMAQDVLTKLERVKLERAAKQPSAVASPASSPQATPSPTEEKQGPEKLSGEPMRSFGRPRGGPDGEPSRRGRGRRGEPPGSASPSPTEDASPRASLSPAGSPTPSTEITSSPRVVTSPAVAPPSRSLLESLAELVSAPGVNALDAIGKSSSGLNPKHPGDRLRALGALKAIDAALKIYRLNHPGEEIKTLDLPTLVSDGALPRDLDLSGYPPMSVESDGVLSMNGFGTIEALEKELADYRDGFEKTVRFREKGLLNEAYAALKDLVKKYPNDPSSLERLLSLELELSLDFEGVQTARMLFLAHPNEPANLYRLALFYYRSSRPERARQIAQFLPRIYPKSFFTQAAEALVLLVESGVSHALMQSLLAQRDTLLASEASPSPAASPVASPALTPEATPSTKR